jgi:hypothetical protein
VGGEEKRPAAGVLDVALVGCADADSGHEACWEMGHQEILGVSF